MKNIIFLITFSAAISYAITGSAQSLQQSDINIGAGVGANTGINSFPISVFGEYAVHENVSLGLHLEYLSQNVGGVDISAYGAEFRGSFHPGKLFHLPDTLDLYGGLGLEHVSVEVSAGGASAWLDQSRNVLVAHIGARYYFSRNFGAYFESNSETSLKLGITFKF